MRVLLLLTAFISCCLCASIHRSKRLSKLDDAVVTWSLMNHEVNKLMNKESEIFDQPLAADISIGERLTRDVSRGATGKGKRSIMPDFVQNMFNGGDTSSDGSLRGDGELSFQEFTSMYNDYDTNGDHDVTREEYVSHFISNGYGDRHFAESLFDTGDLNANGQLDENDLKMMFRHFDQNGDEVITAAEFSRLWQTIINGSIRHTTLDTP